MSGDMTVGYEVNNRIAYISFNRPEKHNAFRDADLAALVAALHRLDGDSDADIAILFGKGRSFSSGGDVQDRLQRSMDEGSTEDRVNELDAFLQCVNWKPVIAAVHGYCLGHAIGTALMCDLLVAGRSTRFQVSEIKIGLPMSSFLPRIGHQAFANEVCMTGRMFSAEEAWHAGMVTQLVEDGEHVTTSETLARLILENPQPGVREHVRVRRLLQNEAVNRYASMSSGFLEAWTSDAGARAAVEARSGSVRPPRSDRPNVS